MKHRLRKLTSVVLAVIMVFSVLTIAPFTVSAASFVPRTTAPDTNNAYYYNSAYNPFPRGQCTWYVWGRAFEITGIRPKYSTYPCDGKDVFYNCKSAGYSTGSVPKVGAIACWSASNSTLGYGHVAIVEKIIDGTVYVSEYNRVGSLKFSYNAIPNLPNFIGYVYLGDFSSGNDPKGCVDGVTGGIGSVTVRGWAFDKDDISKSLDIHVYIGGPAGSGAEGHSIVADQYRPDVNSVYGVGDYHGFSSTIYTSLSGNQEVFIYGINTMGGSNVLLGSQTVFIDHDLYKPVIQTIYITDVTPYAFTVNAVISDDRGVSEVKFSTWKDGSPDVKWYIPKCVDTNTYSYRVNINDLTNEPGVYHTHVYAYDVGRNESVGSIDIIVPDKGLLIYEIVNGNIHIQGANDKTVNEISIPSTIDNKTVTEISDNAFFEFTSLSKITLPDTITRIGNNAFSECWHLKEFTCPSNLLNIGNNAFSCCYGLNKVSFNDNLQGVGDKAFYTTNLNSVCLPKGLSYFGEYSFGYKYDDNLLPQKYDFKIFGYSNSKIYAQNNGIEFISIDCFGDVNLDGTVNIDDVTLIQKYIANMSEFDSEQLKAADVTGDNDISIDDVTAIQKYLAGMITSFANA